MATLTVVLIGAEHPGNLGAVARAMKNFGVQELLLIAPRCSPEEPEAKNRAKWANDVLERARTESMAALEAYDLVIGTTGGLGNDYNLPRTPLLPSDLAERLAGVKGRVALVFGRESDGLTNEELSACDFTVTIPTSEAYPILNLSHAVAILLYAVTAATHAERIGETFPLVRAPEKRQLQKMIDGRLDALDFSTEEKRETQRLLWRRLVGKSFLTQREAMALMGFFRKLR